MGGQIESVIQLPFSISDEALNKELAKAKGKGRSPSTPEPALPIKDSHSSSVQEPVREMGTGRSPSTPEPTKIQRDVDDSALGQGRSPSTPRPSIPNILSQTTSDKAQASPSSGVNQQGHPGGDCQGQSAEEMMQIYRKNQEAVVGKEV